VNENKNAHKVLIGRPNGFRPLGIENCRWEGSINPLNAELNPICHLLAFLGAHNIFHVSRIRVKISMK